MSDIFEELKLITKEENIFQNEPMKKHTTFRTGGPADFLVTPTSEKEMIECLKLDVKKTIIGNGSNLLVKDGGIRGLVIQTTKLKEKLKRFLILMALDLEIRNIIPFNIRKCSVNL